MCIFYALRTNIIINVNDLIINKNETATKYIIKIKYLDDEITKTYDKELIVNNKSQIEESFLTTMGLEEEQEGIEVEVKFAKDMTVILKVDLKTADKEILENIGLDFEDKDMSLEKAISDFKEEGYTCN